MLNIFNFLKQLQAAIGRDVDIRVGFIPDCEVGNMIVLRFDWRKEVFRTHVHIRESEASAMTIEKIKDRIMRTYEIEHPKNTH